MNQRRRLWAALAVSACILSACRPSRIALGPLPQRITEIEGQASLRYSRDGSMTRSRLAFVLVLPGRGRLQALDPLNRRLFEVDVEEPGAVLIVPSKKAYWKASRAEVLEAGLGFPLSIREMAGVISGRWEGPDEEVGVFSDWTLDRDSAGRVVSGSRSGFAFRVEEFFPGSSVPQRLSFFGTGSSGALTLLSLGFNASGAEAALGRPIPPSFVRLSRADMEKILRDEN